MKLRRHGLLRTVYIFWAIVLTVFVVIGGRELFIACGEGAFYPPTSYASTDAYFDALVGVQNGSDLVLTTLARVPADRALLYFCPKDHGRSDFVYGLLSYLTWPREIRKITVDPAELQQAVSGLDRSSVGALIFCALQPPPDYTRGWRIGSQIFVAPAAEVR